VTIDQDRTLHVHIRLNLLRILEEDANKGGSNEPAVSIQSDETYTRIFDLYRARQVTVMV
jgi:hypothetical protein